MKNTRGEPSAGGQTAPRETLPISCLFVLFRSLRVVRAANIVTMNSPSYELSLLRRSRDGLQPSCASNRVVAVSAASMYPRYKNEICSTHAKIAKTQRHDVQINIGKQTVKLG